MRPRSDPLPELLALACAQGEVISTSQAATSGLGRHSVERLVTAGRWSRVTQGVLSTQPPPLNWTGSAWSGILLGGDRARLGRHAAAHLHRLEPDPPREIVVLVPRGNPRRNQPPWTFVRETTGLRSPRSPGTPPRTTVEDTVLDLCDQASRAEAIDWVTRAVQHRLTSPRRLLAAVRLRQRCRHRRLITDLLADVDQGAETPLELAYLRRVERPHGLPTARRQARSRTGRYLRDAVYEEFGLVVELDGRLGHEGMGRFRDMNRDNEAVLAGETTLRYGFFDVEEEPCLVARQVGSVLMARGWTGMPTPCPHCRRSVGRHLP